MCRLFFCGRVPLALPDFQLCAILKFKFLASLDHEAGVEMTAGNTPRDTSSLGDEQKLTKIFNLRDSSHTYCISDWKNNDENETMTVI